ncbi:hypothetical protein AX16_005709 [Volvariella volvacea WC 439]|nr:hypothetical protein AX16_005709 [Volvariella volvacea WC 439]
MFPFSYIDLPPHIKWPLLVIGGQLIFLVGGWGFYIAASRQPIALADFLAEAAADYPNSMTFIITLLSTLFATASSYLHSHAVRYALTCYLVDELKLSYLALAVKIARERPLLSLRKYKASTVTWISLLILGSQTAVWTTLFTPRPIALPNDMTGSGLDISNPDFIQRAAGLAQNASFRPDTVVTAAAVLQASGVAALNAEFGLPAIVNFNEMSFINSTGGIMPVFLQSTRSILKSRSEFAPSATISALAHNPSGFSNNFTVTQQGVVVDTTCRVREPPNVQVLNTTMELPGNNGRMLVTQAMEVTCPDGEIRNTGSNGALLTLSQVNGTSSAILSYPCPLGGKSPGYEMVLHGFGTYGFIGTISCTMIPQLTEVQVHYGSSSRFTNTSYTNFVTVGEPQSKELIDDPTFAVVPFSFLQRHLESSQSLTSNDFGNIVSTYFYYHDREPDAMPRIIGAYLSGVFESSGTILRATLTQTDNGWLDDTVLGTMKYDINGTYFTGTMGWDHRNAPLVPCALMITSIIAISAIAFVALAAIKRYNNREEFNNERSKQEHLDLGEFSHLIAVAFPKVDLPDLDRGEGEFLQKSDKLKARLETGQDRDISMKVLSETKANDVEEVPNGKD